MKVRRIIAIVLWSIQALALFGCFAGGTYLEYNLANWFGFFLPTIIGLILWFIKKKKNKNKKKKG